MMEFLRSIGDPDADTPTTVLTSPGTSPSNATVLQGIEQNIAAQVALPYISSGYPKGWSETTVANCQTVGSPTQLCSQGVSPVRGFVRSGGGGESCGNFGGKLPCDSAYHRAEDSFQLGVWTEGVYDMWLAMRDLLGKDWHLQVGGVSDGAMGPFTVTISEKNLTDKLYGAYQQMSEENCINTGIFSTSGCVYTQFSDFLNSPPACTSSGDCLHICITGCSGLDQWFALAAAAPTTNSTLDLFGKPWQFLFESQLQRPGAITQELGSHMMQFGVNYILADGSNASNHYAVNGSIPVLSEVPVTVNPNPCVGPSTGTGTCTITWTAPANLCSVGTNCPDGVQYRLKYLPCQAGVLTIYGNDCPVGGKAIVPGLKFHSDTLTAGFPAPDSTGSWEYDPSKNWNWAFTANTPDCVAGQGSPNCNPTSPSGTSYTFNTKPNTTYTFSLTAYVAGTTSSSLNTSITSPTSGNTVSGSNIVVSANASGATGVASVQFQLDGANLGTASIATPYSVNWDTTKSINGWHILTAVAIDKAGNRATSSNVAVTVNNDSSVAPTVSITSPASGAKVLGKSITVAANASSSIGVARVQFQLDGANLVSKSSAPYFASWDTTTTSNSSHILTAIAFDTAGNHTTSNAVSVTVSNGTISSPTVSIGSPTPGSKLSNAVSISASASSSVRIAGVQFKLDGGNLGTEIGTAPYSMPWNTKNASNGIHTLTAVVFDTAGNKGVSNAVSVTVSNGTISPPTVSIGSPTPGSKLSNTVSISASASSGVRIAGVQFKLDGGNLGSEIGTAPYSMSWNTKNSSNGVHTLTAVVFDTAGNKGVSNAVSVTVSNGTISSPTVSIGSPTPGSKVSNTVSISASASSGVRIAGVQFKLDGGNLGSEIGTAPYLMPWNTKNESNGAHTLTAVVFDTAGNKGISNAVSVTVSNASSNLQPPTITFTSPARGATVSGITSIEAIASDSGGAPSVQYRVDGINLGSAILDPPYLVSWDTSRASNGPHTLQAIARNSAGTISSTSMVVQSDNSGSSPAPRPGSKAIAAVDSLTKFTIQGNELTPLIANCSECQFKSQSDLIAGQTTVVLLRTGSATPVADEIILHHGVLNGTITSVGMDQFEMQVQGTPGPGAVLVLTTNGITDYENFPGGSSDLKIGQKVAIRGLLFKSGPKSEPTVVARNVELLAAETAK